MRASWFLPHESRVQDAPAVRGARQRGSSLLEVIIATMILGFVAVGMVEFFAKGRIWFDQEEHKRVATLLAQDALERTVARPYSQINNWSEDRKVSYIPYHITVTTQVNSPETDIKTIWSTVTWQATATAQRNVSLSTFVYSN